MRDLGMEISYRCSKYPSEFPVFSAQQIPHWSCEDRAAASESDASPYSGGLAMNRRWSLPVLVEERRMLPGENDFLEREDLAEVNEDFTAPTGIVCGQRRTKSLVLRPITPGVPVEFTLQRGLSLLEMLCVSVKMAIT